MNRTLKLALAAVAGALFVAPVFAQDNFPDAPEYHWAYEALLNMKREGILVGYPDGLFRGGRPASRYEMAAAIDRAYQKLKGMLGGVQNQIDALNQKIAGMGDDYASKADLAALKDALEDLKRQLDGMKGWGDDIAALKRMADMFQKDLAKMGVDVEAMKKDLADMNNRLGILEKRKPAVDIHGDVNMVSVMAHSTDDLFGVTVDNRFEGYGRGSYSGEPVGITRDWTFAHQIGFDFDGTNDTGPKWHVAVVAGNFLGFTGEGGFGGDATHNASFTPFHEGVWAVYIPDAWVKIGTSLMGKGFDLTLGRQGYQTNPYFFKKPDVTPYFDIPRWDDGNWIFDGAKVGMNFGPNVSLDVWGGRQSSQTATDSLPFSNMWVGGFWSIDDNSLDLTVDRHLGANLNFKMGDRANLMVNYIFLDSDTIETAPITGDDYNRVTVLGGALDFKVAENLMVHGGYGKTDYMENTSKALDDQNTAWWANADWHNANWNLAGGYRRIEWFYAAPGDWGRIGPYWNPRDIQGFWVKAGFKANNRMDIWAKASFDQSIDDSSGFGYWFPDSDIRNYNVGLDYQINDDWSMMLGYERFEQDTPADGTPRFNWYRVGFNYKTDATSSLKLFYEFSDYDSDGNGYYDGVWGPERRGGIFTLQYYKKF